MITAQLNLDIHNEIIIDNFAGGGGASTGIELALGRRVDVAINHDPEAVSMHAANHPETMHLCESVWEINPRDVHPGRSIGLLWLSPDCKHFSKAKGGKPVEKKIRGLAWVAVRWADLRKPRVIMLENVEEFITWGPLVEDENGNHRPCPKNKGREFKSFVNALEHYGYKVEWKELRACDYGTPTIRKRLFLIARCDGMPIVWPAPTHGNPDNIATKANKLKPWRTAAECIDFTLPCPSIFERARPLADATCRRIAKGIMRYVVNAAKPFIITTDRPITNRSVPRDIDQPAPTVTANGRIALIAPVISTYYGEKSSNEVRGISLNQPLHTQTTENRHALVTAFMAKHYGGVVGHTLQDEPLHTITSQDHHSLVTSNLIKMRGDNVGQQTDAPLATVSAGGTHHAEVRAFLVAYYGNDKDGASLKDPMRTVVSKERFGLVTVDGTEYAIADIGMRMLAPRELFKAQGFPDSYIIDHGIDANGNTIKLSKTAQVRMCGNSVCPPLAAALVAANVPEMKVRRLVA